MRFKDEKTVLLCAFRYALGRATYMPLLIAAELEENWKEFELWQQKQIVDDINQAIEHDMAGHDCDKRMWAGFVNRVSA